MKSDEIIGGRYRLERQIGEGGMASVWLATDQTLDREVAIKFVHARDERYREMLVKSFLREAKLAASVQHGNVVQILDFGTHDADVPFMVMERLVGESLADRFDRGDWLRLDEIVHVGTRCLQGLVAVHDAGIVHRDLKPGNIFLVKDRQGMFPKLLDFGISKSLEPDGGRVSAVTTRDGTVVGTPDYMSPEQARGVREIDRRTDIYSMGVILYEAVTGKVPFHSENTGDLLMLVIQGQAPDVVQLVPAVGHEISDVIAKAMYREREQRYRDAAEMHDALVEAARRSTGVIERYAMTYPPRLLRRTGSTGPRAVPTADIGIVVGASLVPAPRRPWMPVAMGGVAAFVLAGAVALASRDRGAPSPPRFIVVQGTGEAVAAGAAPLPGPPAAVAVSDLAAPDPATAVAVAAPATERRADLDLDTPPSPAMVAAAPPKPSAKRGPPRSSAPTLSPAAALARAFGQQKAGVVKCFEGRAAEAEAAATSLSVRVTLDSVGAVREAQVFPESIAGTALGSCIAVSVRSMRFAAQPGPISFRVPLTARRAP